MSVTTSNFRLEPMDVEWGGDDLGATSGGVELSLEFNHVDVTADQTGDSVRDQIQNSTNAEISMTLREVTTTLYKRMLGDGEGDTVTGGSGNEVHGIGDSKQFTNVLSRAQQLTMKPTAVTDKSRHVTAWLAIPIPESINYSGSDMQEMSVTFRCYPDTNKKDGINLIAIGDEIQDLT